MDELERHYRLINACVAVQNLDVNGDDQIPPSMDAYYNEIGLFERPKCIVRGKPRIDAGFLGETTDGYVILAFRGTVAYNWPDTEARCADWQQDLEFELVNWAASGGRTAKGFTAATSNIWRALQTPMVGMNWREKKGLWITGHSKGGAMALLSATIVKTTPIYAGVPVKVVTFGTPMVGNEDFSRRYNTLLGADTVCYQNEFDVVPQFPNRGVPALPADWHCPGGNTDQPPRTDYNQVGKTRFIWSRWRDNAYHSDSLPKPRITFDDDTAKQDYAACVKWLDDLPPEQLLLQQQLKREAHPPQGNYLHCFDPPR